MTPLAWLFSTQRYGITLDLKTMQRLLDALGNPEQKISVLHIAGTNGKGSVSAIAESILRAAGYRTGLYTSPHLVDFSERICLNGVPIEEVSLEKGIKRLQVATRGWEQLPTFFELTTALAFDYFAEQKCEMVVLETGLGGRLDATNLAAYKMACALTPISLDHQLFLGETLSLIAKEKAGIMRSGVPVVSASQGPEATAVFKQEAFCLGAPLHFITVPVAPERSLALLGSHQRWNAALAMALVSHCGLAISQEAITQGLKTVSWPGRFQPFLVGALPSENLLILDGAHNEAGAAQLVATWKEFFQKERCTLIFGALQDKEWKKMLPVLRKIAAKIIVVPVASPRSVPALDVVNFLRKENASRQDFEAVESAPSLSKALEKVTSNKEIFPLSASEKCSFFDFLKKRKKNLLSKKPFEAPVLVAGSLFLVGEALALLEKKPYQLSTQ